MRPATFALILMLLVGCLPQKLPSGGIIRGAGEFAPPDQSWSLSVASDGHYRIHTAPHVTTSFDWKPQDGWFLFIEDAKHLWSFDGVAEFYVFVWTADGAIGRYGLTSYRGVVPSIVLEALPEAVRGKIRQQMPMKDASANRRPAGQSNGSGNLSAIVASRPGVSGGGR